MSAWMTSRIHRSALAQAAMIEGVVSEREVGWLFDELTRCNRLALHYRYGEPHPNNMPPEHREVVEAPLDPHVLIFNISCWGYQCSEYDTFDAEPAEQSMQELKAKLLTKLGYPGDEDGWAQWYKEHRQHNELPWGIEGWEQVVATEQTA